MSNTDVNAVVHLSHQTATLRAQAIKLILMDCDGVLTDGRIILLPDGEEIKHFHVHDGQGVALARKAGLLTGIISGRRSRVLEQRAAEMRCDFLVQNVESKLSALQALAQDAGVSSQQIAFIGDDLPDIAPMREVGLAITVANAVDEVKSVAHLITQRSGGAGAVREAIEFILRAQSHWQPLLALFDLHS